MSATIALDVAGAADRDARLGVRGSPTAPWSDLLASVPVVARQLERAGPDTQATRLRALLRRDVCRRIMAVSRGIAASDHRSVHIDAIGGALRDGATVLVNVDGNAADIPAGDQL